MSARRSSDGAAFGLAESGTAAESTVEFPVFDPDDLAEQCWDRYTARDRIEQLYPPP